MMINNWNIWRLFHGHGDTPVAGWGRKWKKKLWKWMMTGGSPIVGNLHITIVNGVYKPAYNWGAPCQCGI